MRSDQRLEELRTIRIRSDAEYLALQRRDLDEQLDALLEEIPDLGRCPSCGDLADVERGRLPGSVLRCRHCRFEGTKDPFIQAIGWAIAKVRSGGER